MKESLDRIPKVLLVTADVCVSTEAASSKATIPASRLDTLLRKVNVAKSEPRAVACFNTIFTSPTTATGSLKYAYTTMSPRVEEATPVKVSPSG